MQYTKDPKIDSMLKKKKKKADYNMTKHQIYQLSRKEKATRYQLPYIKQHRQCAPRHEALLFLPILSHVQSEIHKKKSKSKRALFNHHGS